MERLFHSHFHIRCPLFDSCSSRFYHSLYLCIYRSHYHLVRTSEREEKVLCAILLFIYRAREMRAARWWWWERKREEEKKVLRETCCTGRRSFMDFGMLNLKSLLDEKKSIYFFLRYLNLVNFYSFVWCSSDTPLIDICTLVRHTHVEELFKPLRTSSGGRQAEQYKWRDIMDIWMSISRGVHSILVVQVLYFSEMGRLNPTHIHLFNDFIFK